MTEPSQRPSTAGLIASRIGLWTLGAWMALVVLGCLSSFLSRRALQFFTAYQHPDTVEGRLAAALADLPTRLVLAGIGAVVIGVVAGTVAGLLAVWRRSIDAREGAARDNGERHWLILNGGLWWALAVPAVVAAVCVMAGVALDVDLAMPPDGRRAEQGGGLFGRLDNGLNSIEPRLLTGLALLGACVGLARGTYLARRRPGGPTSPKWGFTASSLGWVAVIAAAGGPALLLYDRLFTSNRLGPDTLDKAGRVREMAQALMWYPVLVPVLGWPAALILGLFRTPWPEKAPGENPSPESSHA